MQKRNSRKLVRKRDELPSFLKNLTEIPSGIEIPPENKKSEAYLGPVFFGEDPCKVFHPPHQLAPLTSFHNTQPSAPLKENILEDKFQPPHVVVKPKFVSPVFHPKKEGRHEFVDLYTHKCPGVRKIFAPDHSISEGFGKTVSKIEGETSQEIPFYRVKKVISHSCVQKEVPPELEIVTLSDIREEKLMSLPYKERIAHAHFPKEFVTVEVVGPTIPASIIITKLPSKREASFEIDTHLKSKSKEKNEEESEETAEKATEAQKENVENRAEEEERKPKELIDSSATAQGSPGEGSVKDDEEKRSSQETEEGRDGEITINNETEEDEGEEEAEEDNGRKTSEVLEEQKAEDIKEEIQEENSPEEAIE